MVNGGRRVPHRVGSGLIGEKERQRYGKWEQHGEPKPQKEHSLAKGVNVFRLDAPFGKRTKVVAYVGDAHHE